MISHEALKIAYDEHWLKLWLLARKYLRDDEMAKDIVSEAYIRAWEKRWQVMDTGGFLWTTTKRLCIDYLRSAKNQRTVEIIDDYFPEQTYPVDYIEDAVMVQLFKEIESLPKKCKQVFLLSWKGFRTQEIVAKMKISQQNVLNQKHRAIKLLKYSMRKYSIS